MKRWLLVGLLPCACGILSGLDTLTVADGGPDASSDAPAGSDAVSDAPSDGGAPEASNNTSCGRDAGNPHCFGSICMPTETCCVTPTAKTCIAQTGPTCAGDTMFCADPLGCDGGKKCCLQNASLDMTVCPWLVSPTTSVNVSSTCGMCGALTNGTVRICNSDSDCGGTGGLTCHSVTLGINTDVHFGVCM